LSRLCESLLEELHALRAAVGARVARVERGPSTGLLRALVIGARDGMEAERIDLFARTGTSHLLAISGWHVGLFAALVVLPLARVTRRSLAWILARALLLAVFAAIAGAEKPVLRATLALVLLQLAVLRARDGSAPPRRPDALSFLAAAFALECLLDPAGIVLLSLSLSYAATLGLILGTSALGRALRPPYEPWADLAPARRTGVLAGRLRAFLASGLAASAAAVLATLPLVWTTFGEFAPAGVVLTLLALPPFTFLSLLAWLAALVPSPWLALPAELGARALYALLELGDALPGTPLLLPPRPVSLLLLATALAFAGLERAWARRAAALAWGLLLLPWTPAPRGLELHSLDAGHGSAAVLRAPGIEALVFDAGSRDRRALASEALLPLLASWEVASASVVLSHPDHDHASGLPRLSERLDLARWLGAQPAQDAVRLPHDALRLDLDQGRLAAGSPSPALSLALLRGLPEGGNEGSRALEIVWRGERVLLLGDGESEGLERLPLEAGRLRLLLAPHHGSDAPALGALLERCPPAEVWISASEDPPVASELDRRGIEWRWTGRDGPLALRLR
jgi:competence protein ComEC